MKTYIPNRNPLWKMLIDQASAVSIYEAEHIRIFGRPPYRDFLLKMQIAQQNAEALRVPVAWC